VYVNQVGGQDELVFDGASMVFGAEGELIARAPQFAEDVLVVDIDVRPAFRKRLLDPRGRVSTPALPEVALTDGSLADDEHREPVVVTALDPVAEVYEALALGTRDYVRKNGFTDVVIGLSGGIDSSLVACVAVEALGIDFREIAIEDAFVAFLHLLAPSFGDRPPDLTEENLQSRIRGMLLMGLSNKFGWMVLTTGNKSEMAVGYSTLYGDTAGGFAVIKDVFKLQVYELSRYVNRRAGRAVIPETVLVKAPSAELRPDQRDDQSLPPYEVLDPILEAYVEEDATASELVGRGFDEATVRRITRLVDLAEYKRRQSPPGVRVTAKAFGKDRRLPITNGYRG